MRRAFCLGGLFFALMAASWPVSALAQIAPAFHQVTVYVSGQPSDGRTGSIDLNLSLDVQESFTDPDTGSQYYRQSIARAETFGGSGGAPFHPLITASARSSGWGEAQASSVLNYYGHVMGTNDAGLVWRPTVVPVTISAMGHVSGWGQAAVSIRNSVTNQLYLADQARGTNLASPRSDFSRSVEISIAPDSYLVTTLNVDALALDSLTPGVETMRSSQALADPVFTFNQAAFDAYATQLGQPTFQLSDYFAFEFSEGIGNSVPEPGCLGLIGLASLSLIGNRILPGRGSRGRC